MIPVSPAMVLIARAMVFQAHISAPIRNYYILRQTKAYGTCHFYYRYMYIGIQYVHGNLKERMKVDLCIETLSYTYSTMETVFVGVTINYH